MEKVAFENEISLFCYWPNTVFVLIGRVQLQFHCSGTSLYSIGRCSSCIWLIHRQHPVSTECVARMMNNAIGASGHFQYSASGRCCRRLLLLSNRSDASGRSPSNVQSPLWSCFFVILRQVWFLSSCLDFTWYLGSSLVLLGSCLRCWSLDHHVAFVQVTSCTLLNNKTITYKFISPIWLCWSSNTKIQSKWA
jgi:hypothetical protein